MLDDGWRPQTVIAFMSRPPRTLMPDGPGGGRLGQPPLVPQAMPQTHGVQVSPTLMQPNARQMPQIDADNLGMYDNMHQRFRQGGLARSIEQERPMDTVPLTPTNFNAHGMPMPMLREIMPLLHVNTSMMQSAGLETQTTGPGMQGAGQNLQDNKSEQQVVPTIETTENASKPEKKEKPKKATKIDREGTPGGSAMKQGPRCAACIKSHKRCTHRVQTPQPGLEPSSNIPTAAAHYVPTSGAPEGYTPAPQALPDHSFTAPTEQAAIPTPMTSKKAGTPKRKR